MATAGVWSQKLVQVGTKSLLISQRTVRLQPSQVQEVAEEGSGMPESRSPAEEGRRGLGGRASWVRRAVGSIENSGHLLFFIVSLGMGRKLNLHS